ncbi:hypothetical protein J422_04458 [Methanocaldococcus villosus KIN24-T80]|uniref:UPF0251 protein J422_04458 n=1 Tax=Methanocaldococcus villosus KIN24-T80 TaxID=1069083 RepID=N6VSG5_9EURY|nr:DUF134 domain-containing protein [Methanocaldococcus villosus]ENN96091.1 hypothetical protein J422_04458 [Methanocaldococcus villosus KIN24-T80]
MRGRKKLPRYISELPKFKIFKPAGKPLENLEKVKINIDELEAIRLVDYLDYTQEEAAKLMGISRRVLWNLLTEGRKKVADAIINGKALIIEENNYIIRECHQCIGHRFGWKKHCRWEL